MNNLLLLALLCYSSGNNSQCAVNCCDPMSLIVCCLAFSKCLGTSASSLSDNTCCC